MVRAQLPEFVLPAPQHQQVALLQADFRQFAVQPALAPPQADHHHAQGAQEVDVGHAAADEFRVRRDHRLHQLFFAQQLGLAVIARLVAILGHRVQDQARFVADRGDLVGRGAHQQHVAGTQRAVPALAPPAHALAQPVHHLQALGEGGLELLAGAADPGRVPFHQQLGVVAVQAQVVVGLGLAHAPWQQPAAQQHVGRAQGHQHQADRGDGEDAQAGAVGALEQVASQQEGRGAEQGQGGAQRGGQRHRHQQARGGQLLFAGQPHQDRQHHRRDHHMVREGGQQRGGRHHHRDRAPLAAAGGAADPGPDPVGDAGGLQSGREHEHGRHDDRRLAGEAGQGLPGIQDPGQGQRQQGQHGHQVHPHPATDEQRQGRAEDHEEDDLVQFHAEGSVPGSRGKGILARMRHPLPPPVPGRGGRGNEKTPPGRGFRGRDPLSWCPGEDSNLHGFTR